MISNLHTHTYRCNHATGNERDYVLEAIKNNFRLLGFSDHCPLPFPKGYDSSRVRMGLDELSGYCRGVLSLKEEFKDVLDIRLGVELEYYPAYFDNILKELEKNSVEYLILGQHYIGNEIGEPYMGSPLGADILKRYVDQTISGMETGCFLYLAHPDIPNFQGDKKDYEREMRRLCEAADRLGMPLEINLLGMRSGRNYPDSRFWKIAGETGCRAVIGSDAHSPDVVADNASEALAMKMAEQYGLDIISPEQLL